MPVHFLRADPAYGSPINEVDTVRVYFDNRPRDVKITEASRYVSKAIVRGNTVEVSIAHPISKPYIHFTVSWGGGKKRLAYEFIPQPLPYVKVRTDPPVGSSIHDVERITLYLDDIPADVEIWNASSKSIGVPLVKGKRVEVPLRQPIGSPYISFTVAWDSGRTHLRYRDETQDPPRFLRSDPPIGSSIGDVERIILHYDKILIDFDMWEAEGLGEPIIKGKRVEIRLMHPIKKSVIKSLVSGKGKNKRRSRGDFLEYTNEVSDQEE